MNAEITDSGPAAPIQWYARSAVDDFVDKAATRRAELEAAIAAANERTERARAALGLYRMMAAMLLETQRELQEMRQAAEAEAAEIIRAAGHDSSGSSKVESQVTMIPHAPPAEVLDLGAPAAAAAATNGAPRNGTDDGTENAEFFDFLRGSLTDPETLGPRTA